MGGLAEKSCADCAEAKAPLSAAERERFSGEVPEWKVVEGHHLSRTYEFEEFKDALAFVNRVGDVAEKEGHHPDVYLAWGKARLDVFTHSIDGLTESDFILAAKCDRLYR